VEVSAHPGRDLVKLGAEQVLEMNPDLLVIPDKRTGAELVLTAPAIVLVGFIQRNHQFLQC
jgi:hypothetical protein